MSLEQNKKIVLQMYRAFDLQDIEQGQKFMDTNIVGHGMDGVIRTGVDSFMEYATSMFTIFPDGSHQIDEIIAEGDKVVTYGVFSGTHQADLLGFPATGKKVQFSVFHIDRLLNGKIIKHW